MVDPSRKKNQSVLKMARRAVGALIEDAVEAGVSAIVHEVEHLAGEGVASASRSLKRAFGSIAQRPQATKVQKLAHADPAGVLAMMGAEPGLMMEGAAGASELALANVGHHVQVYDERFPQTVFVTGHVHGMWVQLNLNKNQALLVQRIRCTANPGNVQSSAIGLKWGRPAAALGTGAPGHLSPGVEFNMPAESGQVENMSELQSKADVSFMWRQGSFGGLNQAMDESTQEVDLKPNFVLIRSYVLLTAGLGGFAAVPYINLYGKIVDLDFHNVLTVSR